MKCEVCSNEMLNVVAEGTTISFHFECGYCGLSFRKIKGQGWNVWRWSKGPRYGQGILWDVFGLKSPEECQKYAKRRMELESFE